MFTVHLAQFAVAPTRNLITSRRNITKYMTSHKVGGGLRNMSTFDKWGRRKKSWNSWDVIYRWPLIGKTLLYLGLNCKRFSESGNSFILNEFCFVFLASCSHQMLPLPRDDQETKQRNTEISVWLNSQVCWQQIKLLSLTPTWVSWSEALSSIRSQHLIISGDN